MTKPGAIHHGLPDTIAGIPLWITSARIETPEDVAFLSGAASAHLHLVARNEALPQALWRARLALMAAEACVGMSGRRDGAAALRDAVHLLRPGDEPGPAGAVFRQWMQAVARPISVAALGRVIAGLPADRIARCFDAARGHPVQQASSVLEAALADAPRAGTEALILADAALARALGWDHVLPLMSIGLKARDLSLRGDDLRQACHRALLKAVGQAVPLAADLARRAARLRAVSPKLRAKGADKAVEMFLTRDALAPAALIPLMSDRAARRICDRLVELGALRELTGRDTFRLYGL